MKHKATLLSAAVILAAASFADPDTALAESIATPKVILESDALYAGDWSASPGVTTSVRLINTDGAEVYAHRAPGGVITVPIAELNLPDGEYRYEAINTVVSESKDHGFAGPPSSQSKGRFVIENGRIVHRTRPGSAQSTVTREPVAVRWLARVLDLVVSDARAQTIDTSPNGVLISEDVFPALFFDQGPDQGLDDGVTWWSIEGNDFLDETNNALFIYDWVNSDGDPAIRIDSGDTTDTFLVNTAGDISLVNNGLRIERTTGRTSLGMDYPQFVTFDINAPEFAALALRNGPGTTFGDPDTDFAGLRYHEDIFSIFTSFSFAPLQIERDAPSNRLYIEEDGDIGLGTSAPSQPLHLARPDGTAQILVEDLDTGATPKTLFKISSNFNAKFEIDNTDGASWAFTNTGDEFRISRQGSGTVEFAVDNDGSAFIANDLYVVGDVNANFNMLSDVTLKQHIEEVDSRSVLDRLAAMPVSSWEYIDKPGERHMGPMAQDFHAAFGLGDSDTTISVVDASGVALASIRALNEKLEQEVADLRAENATLKAQFAEELQTLKSMLVDLQMTQSAKSLLTASQ